MPSPTPSAAARDGAIWGFAFGYFAAYAPYSALTKAMSQGLIPAFGKPVPGFALLPLSTLASLLGMFVFLSLKGWWRFPQRRTVLGLRVPVPGRWTFLSGLCSAAIIATTTLSYTFKGVSIVLMMLLMRGGVLILAPIVDAVAGRKVRWFSWVALGLSFGSLLVAFSKPTNLNLTVMAVVVVLVYLAGYFVRLRLMSHLAKSDDPDTSTRYFVEEQMVASPAVVLLLGVAAIVGGGGLFGQVRAGFTSLWGTPALLPAIIIGFLSQLTGIFGGLILLDRRENTFCVPVNRASSVLAGIVASFALTLLLHQPPLPTSEMIGAAMVITAIVVLAVAGKMKPAAAPAPEAAAK